MVSIKKKKGGCQVTVLCNVPKLNQQTWAWSNCSFSNLLAAAVGSRIDKGWSGRDELATSVEEEQSGRGGRSGPLRVWSSALLRCLLASDIA